MPLYYNSLMYQTDIEKEAINFDEKFALFNGSIRVGMAERINLMERETVRYVMKKLNTMQ